MEEQKRNMKIAELTKEEEQEIVKEQQEILDKQNREKDAATAKK